MAERVEDQYLRNSRVGVYCDYHVELFIRAAVA